MSNPLTGLVYHWLGSLASAKFYIPCRGAKRWSRDTYWLVGGSFTAAFMKAGEALMRGFTTSIAAPTAGSLLVSCILYILVALTMTSLPSLQAAPVQSPLTAMPDPLGAELQHAFISAPE